MGLTAGAAAFAVSTTLPTTTFFGSAICSVLRHCLVLDYESGARLARAPFRIDHRRCGNVAHSKREGHRALESLCMGDWVECLRLQDVESGDSAPCQGSQ